MSSKKIAIIGSGISGLACGNMLLERGIKPILFEKDLSYGGLISCSFENGNLFHKVGGHVFNSKNNEVLNWFWKHFSREKEFLKASRNAVIFLNRKFINYPIELNLKQLDIKITKSIIKDLVEIVHTKDLNERNNDNLHQFLKNNFGKTLFSLYFEKYNKKIWKTDLKKIPIDWLEGKLPMIDPINILLQNITSSQIDNMVHTTFYYPVEGGSQFIADRLAKNLNIKNNNISKIHYNNNKLFLNNKNQPFDYLIYTGDCRDLEILLGNKLIRTLNLQKNIHDLGSFKSNSTTTVLCECNKNDYSWIYLPEEEFKAHRIIMTGNFSEKNNNSKLEKNRITCTVEYSSLTKKEDILSDLPNLPFNLKPIAFNYSKNSYIIHDKNTRKTISELKKKLESIGIFFCGRFAEWQYFNMDKAIESAFFICNKIK